MPEQQTLDDLAEARAVRGELRAELVRVRQWRHLVRARFTLACAALAGPEPLRPALDLPRVALDLPRVPLDLDDAPTDPPADAVVRLTRLDRRLSGYEARLRDQLAEATDRYVAALAADPARVLDAPRAS